MRLTLSPTLFPLWNDPTDPISLFRQKLVNRYISRSKDDGITTIDINISLSGNNIQSSISDSYSAELEIDSQREVQELTEMYVKAVATVFSKEPSGDTQTEG